MASRQGIDRLVTFVDAVVGPSGQQALAQAKQALSDRQTALKAGDWTAYGQADARLQQALQDALAAEGTTATK